MQDVKIFWGCQVNNPNKWAISNYRRGIRNQLNVPLQLRDIRIRPPANIQSTRDCACLEARQCENPKGIVKLKGRKTVERFTKKQSVISSKSWKSEKTDLKERPYKIVLLNTWLLRVFPQKDDDLKAWQTLFFHKNGQVFTKRSQNWEVQESWIYTRKIWLRNKSWWVSQSTWLSRTVKTLQALG